MNFHFCNRNVHTFESVSTHIKIIQSAIEHEGDTFSISEELDPDKLNILIEGFESPSLAEIQSFCESHNKKIFLIFTEHVEVINGRFFWNTDLVDQKSEYMPEKNLRIKNLVYLLPYIGSFITLGHLPELKQIGSSFPTMNVIRAPLRLNKPNISLGEKDLERAIFFGKLTSYRKGLLEQISQNIDLSVIDAFLPKDELRAFCKKKNIKLCISVPQNRIWKWESPIRSVMASDLSLLPVNVWEYRQNIPSVEALDIYLEDFKVGDFGWKVLKWAKTEYIRKPVESKTHRSWTRRLSKLQ